MKAEISWLGGTREARQRLGGPVLLGTINIEHGKLIISVNSTRRAKKIRRLVEKRLGKEAIYKTTLIEPIEPEVEKMGATAASGASKLAAEEWAQGTERSGVISLADLPPEVRAKLEETARQHWVTWVDLPVPALNNMTRGKRRRARRAASCWKAYYWITKVIMMVLMRTLCVPIYSSCDAS